MKGGHPTKKWQNCRTNVLCVMLYFDGAELARIVNVWSKCFSIANSPWHFPCVILNGASYTTNFHGLPDRGLDERPRGSGARKLCDGVFIGMCKVCFVRLFTDQKSLRDSVWPASNQCWDEFVNGVNAKCHRDWRSVSVLDSRSRKRSQRYCVEH